MRFSDLETFYPISAFMFANYLCLPCDWQYKYTHECNNNNPILPVVGKYLACLKTARKQNYKIQSGVQGILEIQPILKLGKMSFFFMQHLSRNTAALEGTLFSHPSQQL